MGVVMLGAATLTPVGWNGAVFQMFAHGIMTGLFFALVGLVYEKAHTRDLAKMGGFAHAMPAIAAFFTLGALSSLGLPGTAGFVAEFLVFLGAATGRSAWWTIPAVLGAFVTAVYVLRASKIIFWGPRPVGDVAHLGGPAPDGVVRPGGALHLPGGLRRLAAAHPRRHRRHHLRVPEPGGAGGGGAPSMNPWFQLLGPAMAVAAIGAVVLGGDTLLPGRGRLWGWLAVGLLLALLGLSLEMNSAGAAPHRAYVAGPWSLFLQRVLVVQRGAGHPRLDGLARVARRGRQAEYLALVLFSTSGMMMIPGARDWALLVVSFELMGIPLYALVAWAKNDGPPDRPRLAAEAG